MSWLRNNWLIVIIILAIIGILGLNVIRSDTFTVTNNNQPVEGLVNQPEQLDETPNLPVVQKQEEVLIYIDIKGEVNQPGIYQVKGEKRVSDLIELAGGFTEEANTNAVNLAQKVYDEMVIHVAKIGEDPVLQPTVGKNESKIRINYATKEEISTLTGIGEVRANAIIEYREKNGLFRSVDDLLDISGIGEKTLDKIREEIQIP